MSRIIYRTLAFIGKEVQAIFVQPQLLLLLVAGPFAVLLAFGLGYNPQDPQLRTIVVQPPVSDPRQAVGLYLQRIGPPLQVVQVTADAQNAMDQLRARKVDMVVTVPTNAQDLAAQGQVVPLEYFHNAIDPTRIAYIQAVVDSVTSEMNRQIAQQTVSEQQANAADYQQVLTALKGNLDDIRTAMNSGDRARAQVIAQDVRLSSGLVASLWLFGGQPLSQGVAPGLQVVQQAQTLDALLADPNSSPQQVDQAVSDLQATTDQLQQTLQRNTQVSPAVIVAPLSWSAKSVSNYLPDYVAYHSPTVLALLVQHLCITLAALSLVDERSAGAVELFRASPIKPGEILGGKFLAYLVLVALITAGLVALLVYGLRVPMLGDYGWLALVLFALIVYSLSLGFLVSVVARSRSQAIQMSMLLLLSSIFFSGIFVPLTDFALPVRAISYSLPVTYAMEALHQVVLRGEMPAVPLVGVMGLWAVLLGGVTVNLFRRSYVAEV